MKVTLTFTVEQVNAILVALGSRPFVEVADLITSIKTSAEQQLAPETVEVTED